MILTKSEYVQKMEAIFDDDDTLFHRIDYDSIIDNDNRLIALLLRLDPLGTVVQELYLLKFSVV